MEIRIPKNLNLEYISNAEKHYINSVEIFNAAREYKDIIHSAFELRMCIERLCFEYFYLLIHTKRNLDKSERKLYRPKEIIQKLKEESPYFDKMIDFLNAIFILNRIRKQMSHPDFEWINETYGILGKFLHLQKEPINDADKGELLLLLPKALPIIESYIVDRGAVSNLVENAQLIYNKYVRDEIDHGQMYKMLELSDIPKYLLNEFGKRK